MPGLHRLVVIGKNVKRKPDAAERRQWKVQSCEVVDKSTFGFFNASPQQHISGNTQVRYRPRKRTRSTVSPAVLNRPIAPNHFTVFTSSCRR
jgi:hypothetical protein